MRNTTGPIQTYSRTLAATVLPEAQVIVPNQGPLQGVWFNLTVTVAGGTASQTSNTIDNTIATIQGMDDNGQTLIDVHGSQDLLILNDMLQPQGYRTTPPAIAANASGNGSAAWQFFFPFTVSGKTMPAKINLTWAAASSLQNASFISAGTVTVVLKLTAAYSVSTDQPSLRVRAIPVPHTNSDNYSQSFLPNGETVEALAIVIAADADLDYVTLQSGNQFILNQMTSDEFAANDAMLMRSGHLSGELICRVPAFVIDSTCVLDTKLVTDSAITIYTVTSLPQQRAA